MRHNVEVADGFHTPQELLSRLQGVDSVIATRMHIAILALVAKKPVLPITYEFKTQTLFEQIGMGEWVQDIETLNPQTICETLDRFLDRLPELRAHISPHVDTLCHEAYDAGSSIKSVLNDT